MNLSVWYRFDFMQNAHTHDVRALSFDCNSFWYLILFGCFLHLISIYDWLVWRENYTMHPVCVTDLLEIVLGWRKYKIDAWIVALLWLLFWFRSLFMVFAPTFILVCGFFFFRFGCLCGNHELTSVRANSSPSSILGIVILPCDTL